MAEIELHRLREEMRENFTAGLLMGITELDYEEFSYIVNSDNEIVITKISEHLLNSEGDTLTIPSVFTAMRLCSYEGLTRKQVERLRVLDLNQVKEVFGDTVPGGLYPIFEYVTKLRGDKLEYLHAYTLEELPLEDVYLPLLTDFGASSLGKAVLKSFYLPKLRGNATNGSIHILHFDSSVDTISLPSLDSRGFFLDSRGSYLFGYPIKCKVEVDIFVSRSLSSTFNCIKANKTYLFQARGLNYSEQDYLHCTPAYYLDRVELGTLVAGGGMYVVIYNVTKHNNIIDIYANNYKGTQIFDLIMEMQSKFKRISGFNEREADGAFALISTDFLGLIQYHWNYLSFTLEDEFRGTETEAVYIEFFTRFAELTGGIFEYKG